MILLELSARDERRLLQKSNIYDDEIFARLLENFSGWGVCKVLFSDAGLEFCNLAAC